MVLLERVRSQYERLPYPPRDPEDERKRLREGIMSRLTLANHLLWGGRRRYDEEFAVLDAGCGTGDGAIALAEQLRGTHARVVALDFSSASLAVARERAAVRGLENIEFVHASIEEIPALGLGRFDYIVSTGVLHHLASPESGLAALRDALKPDGGLGVMVYGLYGRQPVYMMQALMRYLAPPEMHDERRLEVLKRTLSTLPPQQPFAREIREREGIQREMARGDAALLDLFLHAQDRPYTVPQIYEWLRGADMRLAAWATPALYDPQVAAEALDVPHLDPEQQHAMAELLNGTISKHLFYATRVSYDAPSPPHPDDESAIPTWTDFDLDGQRAAVVDSGKGKLRFDVGVAATLPGDGLTRGLLQRVDGRTPVRAIIGDVCSKLSAVTEAQARKVWRRTFRALDGLNVLVLNPPDEAP